MFLWQEYKQGRKIICIFSTALKQYNHCHLVIKTHLPFSFDIAKIINYFLREKICYNIAISPVVLTMAQSHIILQTRFPTYLIIDCHFDLILIINRRKNNQGSQNHYNSTIVKIQTTMFFMEWPSYILYCPNFRFHSSLSA